ncbi:MAG: ATP-binding protein [Defluviitaleaceae bacterium]|nr:ATP-binding protein [Defluviitaleaceae bacterium]
MRIIPKQTRVRMEFFKNIDLPDAIIGLSGIVLLVVLFTSNIPGQHWWMLGVLMFYMMLFLKLDADRNYIMFLYLLKHFTIRRKFTKDAKKKGKKISEIVPFTGIADGFLEYGGQYYGKVIEIPSVEFRFYSESRQNNIIERVLGSIFRSTGEMMINLVKLDRPVNYDSCIESEEKKIQELEQSYSNGLFNEHEYECRIAIIRDRIEEFKTLNRQTKVIKPFYYLVLFEKNKDMLNNMVSSAVNLLINSDLHAHILDDTELYSFCKFNYNHNFNEREADDLTAETCMGWVLPDKLEIFARKHVCDGVTAHTFRITGYPTYVYNAWGHRIFNLPGTKVVMKLKPLDRFKSVRNIDRSIDELRGQITATGKTSRILEIQEHIQTLTNLLSLLKNETETLFEVNVFITVYEKDVQKGQMSAKRRIRRMLTEEGFRCDDILMRQFEAYVGSGVSGYDPLHYEGRSIHSSSAAAVFPFVYSIIHDPKGIRIGSAGNLPVIIDFYKRDLNHVNSNMIIIGKSGSGKSFATKTILANLAAEDCKIFILDPENEYSGIAKKVGGKLIDAGNATTGRLNPFHIVPSIAEEDEEEGGVNTSFAAHLQFMEEFFRQIVPDLSSDSMETLNIAIANTYLSRNIDEDTDLTTLEPEDFPIFDDLYDTLLEVFQKTESDYGKANLRSLLTQIARFAGSGRNARLWNGAATISTAENFVVFNFQTLLANKNQVVANAQMLLILKWLDNEIIKNRDYNIKYNAQRKIIIVIDEAHVFIDTKYPVALDFMFQLAKRIRKYNGMQIVITQNVKDFVGNEEIARKSTAIINASQYSFIFSLAPNDMHDLCKLYEKAGQINKSEQEEIINSARGQAFVVTSPTNRTRVNVVASEELQQLF